jgi:hypothetical protein
MPNRKRVVPSVRRIKRKNTQLTYAPHNGCLVGLTQTTFAERKDLEHQAWQLAKSRFHQLGFHLVPLCLNRPKTFPHAEPFFAQLKSPPEAVLLTCLPDALAFYQPADNLSWLVELKTTLRETFAIRSRDYAAMAMWQRLLPVLLVVVYLPTAKVFACPIDNLPTPKVILIPSTQISLFDDNGLRLLHQRFPDVQVIEGVKVHAGSKAPFALWRLCDLQPLETLIGGERK